MRTFIQFLLSLMPFVAQALDLGVSAAVFSAEGKPYIEINLEIAAATITYQPVAAAPDKLQAGAEVLVMIKQGEKVINYEKYTLSSPMVITPQSLLDVRRMSVPNGEYTLEIRRRQITKINAFY